MKPYTKAILYLLILTLLDLLLRKGFIMSFIPFEIPRTESILLLFALFAGCAWLLTRRFGKSDGINPYDLGISMSRSNRREFLYGFVLGIALWGIVVLCQSVFAGFSWVYRPGVGLYNIIYGLIFIFIADLGTELYMRGYPLSRFRDSFGAKAAIVIMMFVVALTSFPFDVEGELQIYAFLIPVLHAVFFSIIYFKTKRLGASLGIHTGANFVTISLFDLRPGQEGQAIPSGLFQANAELETLSVAALQMPWVIMALLLCIAAYLWWIRSDRSVK